MTTDGAIVLLVIAGLTAVVILLLFMLLRKQELKPAESESANDFEKYILIDPDTGIYNRAFLQRKLDEEIYRSARYNSSFTLVVMDFSGVFKDTGDEQFKTTFRKICSMLSRDTRFTDVVARTDVTGVAILLSMTPKRSAEIPINRFNAKIKSILEADGFSGEPDIKIYGFPEEKSSIEKFNQQLKS